MSRVIKIKGKILIKNSEVANKTITELVMKNVSVINNSFVFEGYDYNDGLFKADELSKLETSYLINLRIYEEELKEKMKILEEQRKFEELKRLEKERVQAEKERERVQSEALEKIKVNAKKNGYKIKQQVTEDNKVKLILVKRVY